MQLLNNLAASKIIPYIYKLNNGDSLIIHEEDLNIYIILEGIMLLQKQFTNQELITTHILTNKHLINMYFHASYKKNYYYKIEAISKTYIISFSRNYKHNIIPIIIKYNNYNNLYNYHSTSEILIHKNSKQRFIHLMLLLSELFGKDQHNINVIKVKISHKILASIIGSNINTISKIIHHLEELQLLSYRKDKIIIYSLALLSYYRYL